MIHVTITQELKKAFGIRKTQHYHDVRTSVLGLPFESEKVLISSEQDRAEFHQFNRDRLLAALKKFRGTQRTDMLGFDFMKAVGDAKGAVESITGAWKSIAEAFKTVKKTELTDKIMSTGYKKYVASSRFIRSIGIPNDKWDTYRNSLMVLTGLDKNERHRAEAIAILDMASFIPENAWNANDFSFGVGSANTCNSFVAITKNDMFENRSHVVAVVAQGAFDLAPNVFIYTEYKSVAGGISETQKVVRKEVPRDLTEADVKGINAMMLLSAAQVMADNFGVPFKLPEDTIPK